MGDNLKFKEWETHLVLHFGTTNAKKPSEVEEKLQDIGFESSLGTVDFTYKWKDEKPSKKQVLKLADEVSNVLDGTGAVFNLDTNDN